MTSLRQPVGVWHEIVIQARGDTTYLSMDSIFSHAFYAWTFLCFVHLPLSIKLLHVYIAFKCIAWWSCLCVNRHISRKRQQNQIKSYRIIRVRLQISIRCEDDHRNSQSTLNNRQSLAQSPTSLPYLTHWLRSILCVNWSCTCPFSLSNASAYETCLLYTSPSPRD